MRREDVEKFWCQIRIRAVIECQCDVGEIDPTGSNLERCALESDPADG